jgi:hypothetical protein
LGRVSAFRCLRRLRLLGLRWKIIEEREGDEMRLVVIGILSIVFHQRLEKWIASE